MTQGNAETADAGASGLLRIERADRVLTVGLNRPAKRNALNDGIILEIGECFASLPEDIGAVVIHGIGDHFSSGLDLSELTRTMTPPAAFCIPRCGTGCSTASSTAACP